jgi:NADH-quinone oxidoreductase subunit C
VPDATGLELIAQDLRGAHGDDSVLGTQFFRNKAAVDIAPARVREMLDMTEVDRITVRLRVPLDAPNVPSVTNAWPTADHQEREVYDMFGVIFDGHPDLRRILMPEDYEGHPQRRDFPIGGEPVLFTHNEPRYPRYTQ